MTASVEAARLLQALASPSQPGESVKAAIARAARRAGLPAGLCKRLWYGEARRIDADTMDQLRASASDILELEQAVDARRSLLARLEACEAALGLQGKNSHSPLADGSR